MSSEDKRIIEQTASTTIPDDAFFIFDSALLGTFKISGAILKALLGANGTQALEEIANAIAEEYDSTHTYSLNDWVFHEGTLYRCISQSVTGTWDATKWQAKTIKEFIDTAKNSVLSTIEQMFGEYMPFSTLDSPSIEAISKGDIFIYQRTNKYKFYRAKADHPQGVTEFDIDDWDEFDTVADLIEDVTEKIDEIEIPVKNVQVKTDSAYDSVVDASGNAKIDLSSVTAYGEVPNLPQTIATFKDGADAPMKSLVAEIEPQQDLHGYDAPWVGGAGKNKFDNSSFKFVKGYFDSNGNWNGETTIYEYPTDSMSWWSSIIIDITKFKNDTITYSGFISSGGTYRGLIDENFNLLYNLGNSSVASGTINLANYPTAKYLSLAIMRDDYSVASAQLEIGSTATSYAPYSNICPISGWSEANVGVVGKNLFGELNPDKWINADGDLISDADSMVSQLLVAKANQQYVLSSSNPISTLCICFYDKDMNKLLRVAQASVGQITATAPIDSSFMYAGSYKSHNNLQLEFGSTPTEYTPYTDSHTYTIDLDGTRYGGTLDVVSGVLTVDRGFKIFDGSNDEVWTIAPQDETAKIIGTVSGLVYAYTRVLSNIFKTYEASAWLYENSIWGRYGQLHVNPDSNIIPSGITQEGLAEWKTWLGTHNLQVVYKLATPVTIQLTPTQVKSLLGSNNVWADTGDITDAEYVRDATATINDILARLEALEG